jgi:phenylalanyl-tRNA synthetase beta chain
VLSGAAIADARVRSERVIALDLDKMNERIGTNLSIMEVAALMRRLQFPCEKVGSDLHVTVPHRRGDITIPEDLYEEVARLYGYDELPSTLPVGNTTQGKRTAEQAKRRKMEAYLRSAGLSEAISYALTSSEKAALFAAETIKPIQVAMPMSEERSTMRTSLLPHLYDICAYNLNRKNNDVLLYERGSVFLSEQETLTELPTEQERLAVLLSGTYMSHPWQGEKKAVDFYVLKGIAEGLMESLGLSEQIEYKPDVRPGFHPGRTANVLLKGESIGFLAQVHPSTQKTLDLNETYVLELNVDALFAAETEALIYRGIPRYPAITRDMALVVSKETTAAELMAIIREAGGELVETVSIFDVYEGEHMESGKKSIAFSLTYRHAERTLTDEEASLAHERIVAEVQKQTGAVLRA